MPGAQRCRRLLDPRDLDPRTRAGPRERRQRAARTQTGVRGDQLSVHVADEEVVERRAGDVVAVLVVLLRAGVVRANRDGAVLQLLLVALLALLAVVGPDLQAVDT